MATKVVALIKESFLLLEKKTYLSFILLKFTYLSFVLVNNLTWFLELGYNCNIFMTIPTVSLSKFSIVEAKNKKKRKETTIWKRYYIDVFLLVLSLYMLYNFNEQKDVIAMKVLAGASLDPILFLSSSLFMLGVGLIGLRIMHLGIRAIYFLGRKRWNPVFYTSFLHIILTEKKQTFISFFLIFTLAFVFFIANI